MTIEERNERIAEIDEQLRKLNAEKQGLKNENAAAVSEFKIGDEIEWKHGNGLRKGIVRGMKPWVGSDVILMVQMILRSGSPGQCIDIYTYHHPKKVPA